MFLLKQRYRNQCLKKATFIINMQCLLPRALFSQHKHASNTQNLSTNLHKVINTALIYLTESYGKHNDWCTCFQWFQCKQKCLYLAFIKSRSTIYEPFPFALLKNCLFICKAVTERRKGTRRDHQRGLGQPKTRNQESHQDFQHGWQEWMHYRKLD